MFSREPGLLKISEVAEKARVLPSTIRHYTDLGLVKFAATTDGGHRLYHESETLAQLARIKRLSSRGMSLPEIKQSLNGEGKKRVLVVDDEQEVCDLVKDILTDRGNFEIRVAMDGFTAGRVLSEYDPDLVVLDLMLPGIDGFAVCRQIRAEKAFADTKIIAVTGYDTPEHARKIMEAGADRYLTKPLETKEFLKAVKETLEMELVSPLSKAG